MADYYALISRAISGEAAGASSEFRRALYNRARAALQAQLSSVQPPLTDEKITAERLSLEEAMRRVEQEAAQRARGSRQSPDMDYPLAQRTEDALSAFQEALYTDWYRYARTSADLSNLKLPPATLIPEQNEKKAIGFRISRRGPLDLLADARANEFDPEQIQLYSRIRYQLVKLKEDIPSQERAQIDDALNDFLEQPDNWNQVEFKKVLWLCGNSLRNVLAQHDAVKLSQEPHYSKLPPSVAEALRKAVEGWNVFVLGDYDLTDLDAKRIGPQEQADIIRKIEAARPILETAAVDRQITTERAGKVLIGSLKAAAIADDNIHTKQAQDLAEGTSRNFVVQAIRSAYLFCQDIIDPQTEQARVLSAEYKKGAAKAGGATTVAAIVGAATYGVSYAASFFEFVVANSGFLKEYIVVAFQNGQLIEIIDAMKFTKQRLRQ